MIYVFPLVGCCVIFCKQGGVSVWERCVLLSVVILNVITPIDVHTVELIIYKAR